MFIGDAFFFRYIGGTGGMLTECDTTGADVFLLVSKDFFNIVCDILIVVEVLCILINALVFD